MWAPKCTLIKRVKGGKNSLMSHTQKLNKSRQMNQVFKATQIKDKDSSNTAVRGYSSVES